MVYLKIINGAVEAFSGEDTLNKYTDGTYDLSLEDEEWEEAGGAYLDSDGNIVIGSKLETAQTTKLAALETTFMTWLNDTATMVSSMGFNADASSRAVMDIAGLYQLARSDNTYSTMFKTGTLHTDLTSTNEDLEKATTVFYYNSYASDDGEKASDIIEGDTTAEHPEITFDEHHMTYLYVAPAALTHIWERDTDALSLYGQMVGYDVMRDRFGYLNQFSKWKLYPGGEEFPDSGTSYVFSDLMDSRATELLQNARANGHQLYIFLSGGVDSTAVTIAMLKAAGGQYDNLHIAYTKYTEEEYPEFVAHLRTLGIPMVQCPPGEIDNFQAKLLADGNYALTGWAADQLFGSIVNQNYPKWYFKDWRDWLGLCPTALWVDDAIPQFEAAFKHYGLPIETFGQFAWFMNFACKYNVVIHTDVFYSGNITHRMISFFNTPEFNSWSVSNFDKLHQYNQQDTEHYKIELKNYIYEYNHDDAYRANKGKIGSWAAARNGDITQFTPRYCVMESPEKANFHKFYKPFPLEKAGPKQFNVTRNLLRLYRKSE